MAKSSGLVRLCLLLLWTTTLCSQAYGEEPVAVVLSGYRSLVDENLTIRKTALLPMSDNVNGIYAHPLEAELRRLMQDDHRYNFAEATPSVEVPIVDELEEEPAKIQELAKGLGVDSLVAVKISKGPHGISITLDLFLANDGKLLLQESLRDFPRFEISELKDKIQILYRKLMAHMPYDGVILSRSGTKVTLSLGKRDGVQVGQVLNAILILQVQRHPKFNFMISSEKEILGKIRLTKVDEALSFGSILTEKDAGSIHKLTKIAGLETIAYGDDGISPIPENKQNAPTDGDKEWVPIQPPTFGLVGIRVGFGTYTHSSGIDSGPIEGHSSFYPSLGLLGELWLNPHWIIRAGMSQGLATIQNSLSGSTPGDLNVVISNYNLSFGYNVLMKDDFWGPKITVFGGFSQYKATVDSSEPVAFTSMTYSGLTIGLEALIPVDDQKIWAMGAGLNYVFQPTLIETPVSSGGTSKNIVTDFYLFGRKKLGENLQAVGSLEISGYSSSFTGNGTRSQNVSTDSQKSTILAGGINYLF